MRRDTRYARADPDLDAHAHGSDPNTLPYADTACDPYAHEYSESDCDAHTAATQWCVLFPSSAGWLLISPIGQRGGV